MSILPEFLTPYKRYSLPEMSRVFYLFFALRVSLCLIYVSLCAASVSTMRGWLRDWDYVCRHLLLKGFVEAGISSREKLREKFTGTKDLALTAFLVCDSHVFEPGLGCAGISCGEYVFPVDHVPCDNQRCREILPVIQLRLQGLSPPLWPLRNP